MAAPSEDKQWASKYLLDPLTAPAPSEETGPGTHFRSSVQPRKPTPPSKSPLSSNSSSGLKTPSTATYPTPPASVSPTQSNFSSNNPFAIPHRQAAFGDYPDCGSNVQQGNGKGRRRQSSLGERFAGDMSHRPLDQLRKEAKAADRAPHLRKQHIPAADLIDSLDKSTFGGAYHHEGPYDATLRARNLDYKNSPVAATRETNDEALRATPREYIKDSLDKHLPLQGTANIPPGMVGHDGKVMKYREGADLMRESDAPGGAYKRWDHVKYLPEDYKGKGEPSFSLERALKEKDESGHRRVFSDGSNAYEMQPQERPGVNRQRSISVTQVPLARKPVGSTLQVPNQDGEIRRSNTTGRRVGEGLKRRFGSLRRSKKSEDV